MVTHLFLHASPGSRVDFDDVLALAPRSARCLAFDLPDHGAADDCDIEPSRLESAALDVLDSLGGAPLTVVGSSLGAWIAARLASRRPDRIARLVLVAGFVRMDEAAAVERRNIAVALRSGALTRAELEASVRPLLLGERASADVSARFDAHLAKVSPERWARLLERSAALASEDFEVARYETSAIVLHATADRVIALDHGRALAALGARAELEVVDSDAHALSWTHPALIARAAFA